MSAFASPRPGNRPPEITVVLSSGGDGRLRRSTLESIRSQTLRPRDISLVNDDGSPSGAAAARNAAFSKASTPYVFILNAGDALLPSCLERLSAALDNCPAAYAYSYLLHAHGKRRDLLNVPPWSLEALRAGPGIQAMALVRRSLWKQIGGFRGVAPGWDVYDFWLRSAGAGGWGVQVPEILGSLRGARGFPPRIGDGAVDRRIARFFLREHRVALRTRPEHYLREARALLGKSGR